MRLKNILRYTALSLAVMTAASCLKDQQDIFDKTASARMQEFLENARTILTGAEHGWRMEYFTDYGGYNYALKFKDGEVTASSEMKPGQTVTSYFKLTTDDGPVLSFDTHNEILHFFATPSQSEFEGKGGDFEFIILSAEPDEIVLKGERSGKIARLYPLDRPVADYTQKMAEIIRNLLVLGFDCDIDGDTSWSGRFDLSNRSVVFGRYDQDGIVIGEEIEQSFIYTETGVKLYSPIVVNEQSISVFDVSNVPGPVVTDNDRVKITARAIPDDYLRFEDYVGTYSMTATGGPYTVTLDVYDEFERVFEVSGIGNYQIFLYYDINTGNLLWDTNYIHQGEELCPSNVDGYYVILMGLDSNGSLTTSYGMKGVWNGNKETPVINFVSGTETAKVVGFLLWNYSSEGFGDQYSGSEYYPSDLRSVTSMRKIN